MAVVQHSPWCKIWTWAPPAVSEFRKNDLLSTPAPQSCQTTGNCMLLRKVQAEIIQHTIGSGLCPQLCPQTELLWVVECGQKA